MIKKKKQEFLFRAHICPECGNEFYFTCSPEEYAYQVKGKKYCSWHCMRAVEKKTPKKKLAGLICD